MTAQREKYKNESRLQAAGGILAQRTASNQSLTDIIQNIEEEEDVYGSKQNWDKKNRMEYNAPGASGT